ncbi:MULTISPECIES: cation diffusion facilitator family transporter [unclassified Clostridium]|uniref:cation diffusion facilitator family transporter n=1 Tax=unclassified Clostridium TaxID=2614128 RepID=UPI0013F11160|nr:MULTISPECIES: cation diffusion facilitator family transporter [unclassified Clostridium]MBN1044703.1 cation transporter [Clostridium botulinum]MBN1051433.1 cation transporter [Clostridium botulinum]MBN1054660.1 cation transporter [Clostridium botulinum]NFN92963.1 cation transporter [Clostridium botulinum]NFS27581.1 cation transporter [Clostridium botulinum]
MKELNSNERLKIGYRVSIVTIIGNVLLSIIKIGIGIIASSKAMIADGVHSLSDVFSTIGVIIGLKLSSKKADKEHPYGHEKFESLTSVFLGIMLLLVSLGIGFSGIKNLVYGNYSIPGSLAIFAAVISIVSKEAMYWYTLKYAEKINSTSLKADAWHHRSDSFSSIGALIGIIGARMGFPMLDPAIALVISIIIIKVSYDILKQSINQLMDTSVGDNAIKKMNAAIHSIDGVKNIDNLKTRLHANKVYVDVEISVESDISVEEGHKIAMNVHNIIEENKDVKHCMVHVNPFIEKKVL